MDKIVWWLGLSIIGFWVLGGQTNGRWRDVPVPILMGIGIALVIKDVFAHRLLYGIITCVAFQIIRLGYGNYED